MRASGISSWLPQIWPGFAKVDAVILGIVKQATANPLDVSKAMRAVMPELTADLPAGMDVEIEGGKDIEQSLLVLVGLRQILAPLLFELGVLNGAQGRLRLQPSATGPRVANASGRRRRTVSGST